MATGRSNFKFLKATSVESSGSDLASSARATAGAITVRTAKAVGKTILTKSTLDRETGGFEQEWSGLDPFQASSGVRRLASNVPSRRVSPIVGIVTAEEPAARGSGQE